MLKYSAIIIMLTFPVKSIVSEDACDRNPIKRFREGNMGQTGMFPWLGLLRVHLHEGTQTRIAVTGLILVKATHALAIAEDVVKIPKNIFEQNSEAMFIPNDNEPWFCKLNDYLTHPEYETSTSSTIAIVELEPDGNNPVPVAPICWPSNMLTASNELYALGFTDEKQLLEKMVYKVQYIDKSLCEQFYNREVIGFGIQGPGCAGPCRFIEMYNYLPWIERSTSSLNDADYTYRRSAFSKEFNMRKTAEVNDIPIHYFFRSGSGIESNSNATDPKAALPDIKWFFHNYETEHWREYEIDRIDKDTISIRKIKFKNYYQKDNFSCETNATYLAYQETIEISASPLTKGIATYQIALMDLLVKDYLCAILYIDSLRSSETSLWYGISKEIDEPLDTMDKTPEYLLKKYPIPKYRRTTTVSPLSSTDKWKPHENMELGHYLVDKKKAWRNHTNVNLLVHFKFLEKAELKLNIWGSTKPIETPIPKNVSKAPKTKPKRMFRKHQNAQRPIVEVEFDTNKSEAEHVVVASVLEVDRTYRAGCGIVIADCLCVVLIVFTGFCF